VRDEIGMDNSGAEMESKVSSEEALPNVFTVSPCSS
jgi:hypothetical protein